MYYSDKLKGFIPDAWKEDGSYAEWPEDAIVLTEDEIETYWGKVAPAGKMLGVVNGRLAWVDLPPLSNDEIIQNNMDNKLRLMSEASKHISLLTDATDPDIMGEDIFPEDIELLKQWKAYRVKLSRITDMLNPVWPTKPEA